MSWFKNMTLRTKLLTGFITVAIIAGVIGAFGIYNLKKIDEADTKLYEKMTVPIGQLANISTDFQRLRVNARDVIAATTPEERERFIGRIKELRESIAKNSDLYEKTLFTEEGRKLYEDFKKTRAIYGPLLDKIVALTKEGKADEARAILQGDAAKASREEQNAIDKLVETKIKLANDLSNENTAGANKATIVMVVLAVVGVIIAIGLGLIIARIVMRQLGGDPKHVGEIANMVAVGDLSGEIHIDSNDTTSVMAAMKKMVNAFNEITANAKQVAQGNLMVCLTKREKNGPEAG